MPYRILINTHHITSRAKISRLIRAAERIRVSVLIKKTASPPGIMICDGDTEEQAREWLSVMKGLHYKGYRHIKSEALSGPRLIKSGRDGVQVVDGPVEFRAELDNLGLTSWWQNAMGFAVS